MLESRTRCILVTRSDPTFLKDAKNRYEVWQKSYKKGNKEYYDKVKKINESFKLKKSWRFNTKLSPKFWAGDIDKRPKFIVVSLNPGLSKKIHKKHMERDAQGWEKYKENRKSWFKRKDFQNSPYWKQVNKFICGMDGITPRKKIDADYITENVLNLNLFPYHSKETKQYSETFNVKELKIIIENLDLLFDLIKSKNPDYCFFSGKVWETLLIEYKLFSSKFKEKEKYKPKKKKAKKRKNGFRIYFLKQYKIKYVVLNRFFVRAMSGEGITGNDLIYGIPKFIKKHS